MRVWVSGASGRLGSATVKLLREAGHDVRPADVRSRTPVDLEDPLQVRDSMAGCDAIIHCAGIPSPDRTEPADLVRVNTMTTFNALEQAWSLGIRTAVLASSGSIYGTAWGPSDLRQPYVPVDEDSPLQYVDPYALTKDFMERMGQMYGRRGMTVTALRFHWILNPAEVRSLSQLPAASQIANLWGYVDLHDAARACRAALTPPLQRERFEVCLIAARDTSRNEPTEPLLSEYSPETRVRKGFPGTAGCFDLEHARRVIGWTPEAEWRPGTPTSAEGAH